LVAISLKVRWRRRARQAYLGWVPGCIPALCPPLREAQMPELNPGWLALIFLIMVAAFLLAVIKTARGYR